LPSTRSPTPSGPRTAGCRTGPWPRDQLHESARQDPARPSSLERVCAALIDRDEALRQARSDLEKMRTLAAN
jgi:hypothetical protein